MRKLLSGATVLGLVVALGLLALPAMAHNFGGDGDCDGWTLQLDGTWNALEIFVDGQSVGLDQTIIIPDSSSDEERSFVVVWDKAPAGPSRHDVTVQHKLERVLDCEEEPTSQEVQIRGFCLVDQSGTARALFDAEGRPGATFIVNGAAVGSFASGQEAEFGTNTWTAIAGEGFVIDGESSGEFVIEDCSPTTTTAPPETTTTIGTSPTTVATPETPTTLAASPTTLVLETLPFTGPADAPAPLLISAVSLILLGLGALVRGRTTD